MKNTLFCLFFSFFFIKIAAQQLPLFTQYREYLTIINPAAVNSDVIFHKYHATTSLSHRSQWLGTPDAPKTQVLRGDWIADAAPNADRNFKLLLGGHLINDQIGRMGTTGAYVRVAAYTHENREPLKGGFSAGLNFGAVQYRLNLADPNAWDANDPALGGRFQETKPDVSVGIFGYRSLTSDENNVLYGGLSIPQVLSFRTPTTHAQTWQRIPHYYGNIGFLHTTTSDDFFDLSSWFHYVPKVSLVFDANFRYFWQANNDFGFWLGLGYSTQLSPFVKKNFATHLEGGIILGEKGKKYLPKLGVAFDNSWGIITPFFRNTIEVNLSLMINSEDN